MLDLNIFLFESGCVKDHLQTSRRSSTKPHPHQPGFQPFPRQPFPRQSQPTSREGGADWKYPYHPPPPPFFWYPPPWSYPWGQ